MNMQVTDKVFPHGETRAASFDPSSAVWTYDFISSVLATARTGSWQLDLQTGLATWDAITSDIFGMKKVAHTTGALLPVHEDDQAAFWESLERSRVTGEPHDMVFRCLRPDGSVRWLHGLGGPFPKGSPCPRYIAGVVSDVTERKHADEAREESERQLSSLIAHLPGVAYRCEITSPWQMRFISEAVSELTGYSAADFLSGTISWANLVLPEDIRTVEDQVAQAIAGGSQIDICYRITCASGDVR